ncbi:MAG: lipopolysaccharide heptosyltransferase II [Verrucomicrobiae bacterium]|nr:lipopolysaccharide heptosyltransferase II [Verrucomicrobiae bacterium]
MTFDIPNPNRILVRGVNWLGDAVMTTPALTRLRERFPDARVSLLTKPHLAPLWRLHACVDEVIEIQRGESISSLGGRLREHDFDLAIALPNSFRTALELRFARIPHRVGYEGNARRFLLNHRLPHRPNVYRMSRLSAMEISAAIRTGRPAQPEVQSSAHHIHHYLNLMASLGANPEPLEPHWTIPASLIDETVSKFGLPEKNPQPIIGINAGAEFGPAKRWPTANFREVVRILHHRRTCRFILFGGPGDLGIVNEITENLAVEIARETASRPLHHHDLAGKTSLPELAAALSHCHVLISNDTGPTHLAAAVGTPVVVPFGSTSAPLTGPGLPGSTRHRFLTSSPPCAPCFRPDCPIDLRCLNEITPLRVADAASEILEAI